MSWFLAMTVPGGRADVASCFRPNLSFWQVTNAPLGKALLQGQPPGEAYLVTLGQISDDLLGRGRNGEGRVGWFLEGVEEAARRFPVITVTLLWMQGQQTVHSIAWEGIRYFDPEEFRDIYPELTPNCRYVIEA